MWSSVEQAVAAFRAGGLVIVVDDEEWENEGDLVAAAQLMTTERMAFIVRHSSGVVCAAMDSARLDALNLPLMCPAEARRQGTAFAVSADLAQGVTTGISAADRAATVRALADPVAYAARLRPSRTRLPAPRSARRGTRASRSHRGRRRSRRPGRAARGGRHRRDRQRRRQHGPPGGPAAFRAGARPANDQRRRPGAPPSTHGAAGTAWGPDLTADPGRSPPGRGRGCGRTGSPSNHQTSSGPSGPGPEH